MVGKILGSRYEVLDRIGTGGMSLVYRARDLTLNRIVAVKILKQQWAEDRDVVSRFDQEARSAASLTNLHVVQVFDVGREEPDVHYIVMELIIGQTLRTKLDANPVLSVREALSIGEQVADALDAAHAKKLVHRDIKPQNILIAEDKTVKVTDFGIAYATTSGTLVNTRSFLGTVQYLSPEQARGKLVSAQSDLYSLGVVLFEMLTGRLPFEGDSAIGVALKHLQDQAPDVRTIRPTLSEGVSRVVARALAKDPAERYQSAAAMRSDMLRILDPDADLPPVAPAVEPLPPRGELPSRTKTKEEHKVNPKRVWLIVGGVAVVVIGLGIFAFYHWLETPTVAVPNVRGSKLAAARRQLKAKGLLVQLAGYSHSDQPEGQVLGETPQPGTPVKAGQTVELVISSGPVKVTLPNFKGQTLVVVEEDLRALDLKWRVKRIASAKPTGLVLSQVPLAHHQIPRTTTVALTVSKGPTIPTLMPNLIGMTPSEAATAVAKDNLDMGTPVATYSLEPDGTIVDQSPKPYQPIRGVSQVTVDESDGPSPESAHLSKSETPVPFTIPKSAAKHTLFEAVVTDTAGNKEFFYQLVDPGMQVSVPAAWYGASAQVTFYLNGSQDGPPLPLTAPPGGNFPNPGVSSNQTSNATNGVGNQVGNAP
ncbi:MAG: Stk1 family PASTA domain-containing Ser/Thr kinase [Firmicutes bacterium]|jgi:serine/threonine-protein kinase|nr:Stk1 family PASTA domain-containing Ser/Thr kinase [Bacillota bacterium]MCL5066324.1 Stk1 family PASTA domain-containing Ser/Thr kinase [Bacillota bacterium]